MGIHKRGVGAATIVRADISKLGRQSATAHNIQGEVDTIMYYRL